MSGLAPLLDSHELVPPLNDDEAELVATELAGDVDMTVYARSIAACDGRVYFLARDGLEKRLCIMARSADDRFEGEVRECPHGKVKVGPLTHENAARLRGVLAFARPVPVGAGVSLGLGDRLGLATPGHVRAIRGTGIRPVLAQQSMREMSRTARTPENVLDDATWGVVEEGYRDGFGADADHLKSVEDIDATFTAGFRMFTLDPSDHLDHAAGEEAASALAAKLGDVPWAALETTEHDCRDALMKKIPIGHDMTLEFDEEAFLRTVVKYGKAVAQTVKLYRHLLEHAGGEPFELEMSVDETAGPTSVYEHFYVAYELKRLGVEFTSLAPRFVGGFEKAIDYAGDLAAFEEDYVRHARVARFLGPYKISIHSGSDKFGIYPVVARHTAERLHVKTSGTSYLEALRAVAEVEPELFREIWACAVGSYEKDRRSYRVSADPAKAPQAKALPDDALGTLLDDGHARQVLHVTYGSILNAAPGAGRPRFTPRLLRALRANEEVHYGFLVAHMKKHITPFAG
jgi:hypothetical protein